MMHREDLNYYLQKASSKARDALCSEVKSRALVTVIQQPTIQTLMLPVTDPINDSAYFPGKVPVTSAIIRVNNSDGWAMIMDEEPDLAKQVALLDGAFGANICRSEILSLANEGKHNHEHQAALAAKREAKKKVALSLV
jgi:alpha-D-ribose 1-methylphosphonate 5-triphosphate synthase subunit PhnG